MKIFLLCLLLFPAFAHAQSCLDLSGKYRVEKDSEYGDAYTLIEEQNGCESVTETVIYDSGMRVGPNTVRTDSETRNWCSPDNHVCTSFFYRFTTIGFDSEETYVVDGVFQSYSLAQLVLEKNKDITIKIFRRNHEGKETTTINRAKRI